LSVGDFSRENYEENEKTLQSRLLVGGNGSIMDFIHTNINVYYLARKNITPRREAAGESVLISPALRAGRCVFLG
jgi:hypothetical protein